MCNLSAFGQLLQDIVSTHDHSPTTQVQAGFFESVAWDIVDCPQISKRSSPWNNSEKELKIESFSSTEALPRRV